jgi:hypothetical protein
MNVAIFNLCLLAGWLLAAIGAGLWWLPAGLMLAGVSLVGLTFVVARMAGVFR